MKRFLPHLLFLLSYGSISALPQDLYFEGKPIHPQIVVATQWGDSSHAEPKAVNFRSELPRVDYPLVNSNIDYQGERIVSEETFRIEFLPTKPEHITHDSYIYLGSHARGHIVCCSFYDTSATGRFGTLGLVKREGDNLVFAGSIAGGDRGHGACIDMRSYDGKKLVYSQGLTPDSIIWSLIEEPIGCFFPPMASGVSLLFEVDLDDPELKSFPVGLVVDDPISESYVDWASNDIEAKFYRELCQSTKDGKTELSLEEAKQFARKVIDAG